MLVEPQACFIEEEPAAGGEVVPVATVFLTNTHCPWHCVMCDLRKNTFPEPTAPGAIPAQIDRALERLSPKRSRHIKLYNSGSFFDPRAIPVSDHAAIAQKLRHFERVIVENHPALTGDGCLRFRDLLGTKLEVAMGLETVHPAVLPKLNKGMTLPQFASAARFLARHAIALRAFILVQPPFMPENESVHWAIESLHFAFDCEATAATLIPTRIGTPVMQAMAAAGEFREPTLPVIEEAFERGLKLNRGRVFVDAWDLPRFARCPVCAPARIARLRHMNLTQLVSDRVKCCD